MKVMIKKKNKLDILNPKPNDLSMIRLNNKLTIY